MSNPTKASIYIQARLGGKTDEEANELAGYRGRTPGDTLEQYLQAQQVLDDANTWGRGPETVEQERQICEREERNLAALMREYDLKIERVRRRLRAIGHVSQYRACSSGHA